MKLVELFDPRSFVVALAIFGSAGCGAQYVTRGADLYDEGYFVEAAEVFERTEARLQSSTPAQRARYGLYRGATLLALGDWSRAERWLHYSEQVVRRNRVSLPEEERRMLSGALDAVAAVRPPVPNFTEETAIAASRTLPVGIQP